MKENKEQQSKKDEVKKQIEVDTPVVQDGEGTIKIDLSKLNNVKKEVVSEEEKTEINDAVEEQGVIEEVKQEVATEEKTELEDTPVLEEITDEHVEEKTEELTEEVEEAVAEAQATGDPLPENIQKVVDFINETGGSLEDYVKLNKDYSSLNESQIIKEYYQATKPHLDKEDIDILMEDFLYDEELDEPKDIRKAKIAFKEEAAKAKKHLEKLKSNYYEEIKAGSKLNPEQQKAVDFFNRYNKEKEQSIKIEEQQKTAFNNKTNDVFNDNFKGFEYSVGDKKYRFNVKDAKGVKSNQSDINNFVKKFLNEKNEMSDALGYHKSLFTAMNPDAVAKHFYEQGKSDAIKTSAATAKNVDMEPRRGHEKTTTSNGWTVRSVNGLDTSKLRMKIRKK
jgi:hypothetical protein